MDTRGSVSPSFTWCSSRQLPCSGLRQDCKCERQISRAAPHWRNCRAQSRTGGASLRRNSNAAQWRAGAAHVLMKKVRLSPVPNVSATWTVPKPVAFVSQFALTARRVSRKTKGVCRLVGANMGRLLLATGTCSQMTCQCRRMRRRRLARRARRSGGCPQTCLGRGASKPYNRFHTFFLFLSHPFPMAGELYAAPRKVPWFLTR